MKTKFIKLKLYVISCFFLMTVSQNVHSQITYKNIDDVLLSNPGDSYDVDIDQDGTADFFLKFVNETVSSETIDGTDFSDQLTGIIIQGNGSLNKFFSNTESKGLPILTLYDNDVFPSTFNKNKCVIWGRYQKLINGEVFEESAIGNSNSLDKYIGYEFSTHGKLYRGWFCIDLISNEEDDLFSLKIKDFAYRDSPDYFIQTGKGRNKDTLQQVRNLVVTDISDNYNASDCQITFDNPLDDSPIDFYEIYLVEESFVEDFNYQETKGNYLSLSKSSSNKATLFKYFQDYNGDYIEPGKNYVAVIMSMSNDLDYAYSFTYSDPFTLSTLPPIASNVIAYDIGNNHNSKDIQVNFSKATDESQIAEYRIAISRHNIFDSLTAVNLPSGRYFSVAPTGENISVTLDNITNTEGNPLSENYHYHIFVVSVLKSGGVQFGVPHNFILTTPAPLISFVSIEDKSDFGGINDLKITLQMPYDQYSFNDIYLQFVKENETVIGSELISHYNTGYLLDHDSVTNFGGMQTLYFNSPILDINGRPIEEGISYTIYGVVLSGTATNRPTVTPPSQSFILQSAIGELEEVVVANIGNNSNTSEWKLLMNPAENEDYIQEYRIMAVKKSVVPGFNINDAELVEQNNYIVVEPSGKQINQNISANFHDSEGWLIDNNNEVQFYVLAVGNSKAKSNSLSDPSNGLILNNPSGVNDNILAGTKVFYSNELIHIFIPELNENADISLFDVNGRTIQKHTLTVGEKYISTGHLNSGFYFVKIVSSNGIFSSKIFVK
jgi:hypothetical protein